MKDRALVSAFPLRAVDVEKAQVIQIGPGCTRRDLPSTDGARVWVVDIEPGAQWPYIDKHDETGEMVYVATGEVIEGDQRFVAGTYLFYGPGSEHRPRSERGVRLFGFNLER